MYLDGPVQYFFTFLFSSIKAILSPNSKLSMNDIEKKCDKFILLVCLPDASFAGLHIIAPTEKEINRTKKAIASAKEV